MLIAHMDTIAPTDKLKPKVLEDRITSSGDTILGADNRAGITALLMGLEHLLEEGEPGSFTLAFTVREETDQAGARALQVPEGVEMGIVFDSSLRPGSVVVRGYGARQFRANVKGVAAHAGLVPENGVNALVAASRAIAPLDWGRISETETRNVGVLRGGEKTNVVPDHCEVVGEARSLDPEALARLTSDVRASFHQTCNEMNAGLEWEEEWMFKPFEHAEGDAVYDASLAAVARAGLEPNPTTTGGGSDANTLNARGLPSVNLGIGASKPHSTEEFILIEDLEATWRVAVELMKKEDA
jgi:tripeptide aminopeptidase